MQDIIFTATILRAQADSAFATADLVLLLGEDPQELAKEINHELVKCLDGSSSK